MASNGTSPYQKAVSDGRFKERHGWGWRAAVPMMEWHGIMLNHFPGWDSVGNEPPSVALLHIRRGGEVESAAIAKKFDDIATGLFYYRDITEDGIPFVSDGHSYRSKFWFERMEDAIRFCDMFNGKSSWRAHTRYGNYKCEHSAQDHYIEDGLLKCRECKAGLTTDD